MKQLNVVLLDQLGQEQTYHALSAKMQAIQWHRIDQANWLKEYPYQPDVQFQIAYDRQYIALHYSIEEEFLRANALRPNENVWEDSCVEFFVSFDGRENYYNLEFNILGTGLIGYGPAIKAERQRFSSDAIRRVNTFTHVQQIAGSKRWQIILLIPIDLFDRTFDQLSGRMFSANFYKCGDGLPNPHFVSWNSVEHAKPNFHLPTYFGEITFGS
ncbi:MAG: carbohydrate-binding family 9-like protein [Sphingobacterium sp.]